MRNVYIGIGASFDFEKSVKKADKKVIKKCSGDLRKNKGCVSVNLYRSYVDGVDDSKGLYPIFGDTPMIAFVILNALQYNLPVAIVGSEEIGLVTEVIKEELSEKSHLLRFKHEGLNPSIASTKSKLVNSHNLEGNDAMLFLPIDLPFCYDLSPFLKDIKKYDFIYYLNALEKVFNGVPLFNRNYYDIVKDDDKKILHIKEANVMSYKGNAFPYLLPIFDSLYGKRKGGAYLLGLISTLAPKLIKHPIKGPEHFLHLLSYYVSKKIGFNGPSLTYSRSQLDDLAELLINDWEIINKAKIEFHNDPLAIRDGDALHDIIYFRLVIENAIKNGGVEILQKMLPYGDLIPKINNRMKDIKKDIGLLVNFPEFIQAKISRLNNILEKKGIDYRINDMFNAKGELIAKPAPGDNIEASISFLGDDYMPRFKEDKKRYGA